MKKGFFVPFLALILVLFARQLAFSDMANKYISFQGRIVDANSQPLADGNYSIVFKLCETEAGACTLWSETQPTVSVTNGLFSVLLGSVTTLDPADFNQDCWLTFNVNAGPDYSPRQKIGVSAYALNIADLQVTTGKIAPGTAGQILMSNGTPATTWTSMSGDATINSTGVVAIAADAVALGTDTTGNYAGSNAEGGSATNAFACSGDATCEIQSGIQSISNNSITIDALNTGAASTITLTNSNAGNVANVNIFDGALQIGGTSVISSARSISNVVDFTNTGTTTLGDAGTDALNVYPNEVDFIGNVSKTFDIGPGILDTTLFITNSDATKVANLNVEGSVTATSFSGSASNALACSGDATCEANAITVTNDISVSSGSVTVTTGNLSVTSGNVTIGGTINTGIAATEVYQMNQAVRTTDAVTFLTVDTGQGANELYDMDQNVMTSSNVQFANINSTPIGQTTAAAGSFTTLTATGNTTLGDAGADTLKLFSTTMDWNDVDENKTIQVGSGVTDRTLTIENPDVTGKANLTLDGTVTAFAFSGSSTNALACSGDATCETNAISATGSVTATGALSGTTLNTGQGAYELYAMNQDVQTTSNVTHANLTSTGNTQIGDAGADTLTVNPATFTWSNDTDKYIDIANSASTRLLTIRNPGAGVANLSVEGTLTAAGISNTGNLQVNEVLYSNGNIYLDLDNDNNTANSLYVRNGGDTNILTMDESGNTTNLGTLTITGGTTTLNNGTSNLINFGSVGVAVPSAASAGWKIKTYGNNYGLGIEGSTQWFSTGRYYKFYNSDGSTFWKQRILFDTDNTLTYPAVYAYDNAATPAVTLIEFKTGMYNNGGTFYSQNQIYARGGIANDTASTKLALNDADGVTLSGPLYYGSDPFVKWIAYSPIADANGTPCPTSYKVISCFTDAAATQCSTTSAADGEGGYFCGGYTFPAPDNCPLSGNLLCVYAP